jgi:hypothetical protein
LGPLNKEIPLQYADSQNLKEDLETPDILFCVRLTAAANAGGDVTRADAPVR